MRVKPRSTDNEGLAKAIRASYGKCSFESITIYGGGRTITGVDVIYETT